MSPLMKAFCWITRSRPDIAARSNQLDRMTIAANGIALLTLGVISVAAWSLFLACFMPLPAALLVAALISLVILQIDAALAAADWEIAGVLRTSGPRGAGHWLKLTFRVGIGLVFSIFTGLGVILAAFSDTIADQLQKKRNIRNASLEREYGALKDEVKARLARAVEAEIKTLAGSRAIEVERVKVLRDRRDDLRGRASQASLEAGREVDGLNRAAGAGPRYRDAMRQSEESSRLAASAASDLEQASAALALMDQRLATLSEQLAASAKEIAAAHHELDAKKVRDPRWIPERDGPLTRIIALDELKADPEYGTVVTRFTAMTMLFLLALELGFLIIKSVAPASVYQVRLIAETRLEAAEVSADFARRREAIRRSHPHASLRVTDESAASGSDASESHPLREEGPQRCMEVSVESATADAPTTRSTDAARSEHGTAAEGSGALPVVGARPPEHVTLQQAMADTAAYHVDRGTKTIYARKYWEDLQA